MSEWLIIGVGCFQIIKGKLLIGSYVAFNGYIGKFISSINSLLELLVTFQTLSVSLKRINHLLEKESEDISLSDDLHERDFSQGEIVVSDLKFKYEQAEDQILKGVDLRFKPNSITVIVGLNGSEKSTLFKLLEQLYTYNEGSIVIDGVNIKDISCGKLRKNISYVQQNTFLFSDSVKNNLLFENDTITDDELYAICRQVGIHDFIMSLPKQYDIPLGKGGVNLSGGETQKLAIARALLRKTKIMLLDESTSDLDGNAEHEILNILKEIAKDHTVIMISHRISAILGMKDIYMFKDGRIIAHGAHEELLNKCEDYKKLITNQLTQ